MRNEPRWADLVPEYLPDEIKDAITNIVWGGDNVLECLVLAEVCCRLQREADYAAFTGICAEPIDASPPLVARARR